MFRRRQLRGQLGAPALGSPDLVSFDEPGFRASLRSGHSTRIRGLWLSTPRMPGSAECGDAALSPAGAKEYFERGRLLTASEQVERGGAPSKRTYSSAKAPTTLLIEDSATRLLGFPWPRETAVVHRCHSRTYSNSPTRRTSSRPGSAVDEGGFARASKSDRSASKGGCREFP